MLVSSSFNGLALEVHNKAAFKEDTFLPISEMINRYKEVKSLAHSKVRETKILILITLPFRF